MATRRKSTGDLTDYELAWVVREVAKLTNKSFREIGEALANDMLDNEDSLSKYDFKLGSNIASTLERLWPTEGVWKPGPDAERALKLIQRVL